MDYPSSDTSTRIGDVVITTREFGKTPDGRSISGLFRCDFPEGIIEDPVYKKDAGSNGGGHYHIEGDPSKTPERLRFLHGAAELELVFPDGDRRMVPLQPTAAEIIIIEIPPNVWHRLRITAFSIFSESRTTAFDPGNAYTVPCTAEEFLARSSTAPIAA